jgi:hypothetical protein
MREDLAVELSIEPTCAGQRPQPIDEQPELHDFASKNLATRAIAFSLRAG